MRSPSNRSVVVARCPRSRRGCRTASCARACPGRSRPGSSRAGRARARRGSPGCWPVVEVECQHRFARLRGGRQLDQRDAVAADFIARAVVDLACQRVALDRFQLIGRLVGRIQLKFAVDAAPHRLAVLVEEAYRDDRAGLAVGQQARMLGDEFDPVRRARIVDVPGFAQHFGAAGIADHQLQRVGAVLQAHPTPGRQADAARGVLLHAVEIERVDRLAVESELHALAGCVFHRQLDRGQRGLETALRMQPLDSRLRGGQPVGVERQALDQLVAVVAAWHLRHCILRDRLGAAAAIEGAGRVGCFGVQRSGRDDGTGFGGRAVAGGFHLGQVDAGLAGRGEARHRRQSGVGGRGIELEFQRMRPGAGLRTQTQDRHAVGRFQLRRRLAVEAGAALGQTGARRQHQRRRHAVDRGFAAQRERHRGAAAGGALRGQLLGQLRDRLRFLLHMEIGAPQAAAAHVDELRIAASGEAAVVGAFQHFVAGRQRVEVELHHVGAGTDVVGVPAAEFVGEDGGAVFQHDACVHQPMLVGVHPAVARADDDAADEDGARTHQVFAHGDAGACGVGGVATGGVGGVFRDAGFRGGGDFGYIFKDGRGIGSEVAEAEAEAAAIRADDRVGQRGVAQACRAGLIAEAGRQAVGDLHRDGHGAAGIADGERVGHELAFADDRFAGSFQDFQTAGAGRVERHVDAHGGAGIEREAAAVGCAAAGHADNGEAGRQRAGRDGRGGGIARRRHDGEAVAARHHAREAVAARRHGRVAHRGGARDDRLRQQGDAVVAIHGRGQAGEVVDEGDAGAADRGAVAGIEQDAEGVDQRGGGGGVAGIGHVDVVGVQALVAGKLERAAIGRGGAGGRLDITGEHPGGVAGFAQRQGFAVAAGGGDGDADGFSHGGIEVLVVIGDADEHRVARAVERRGHQTQHAGNGQRRSRRENVIRRGQRVAAALGGIDLHQAADGAARHVLQEFDHRRGARRGGERHAAAGRDRHAGDLIGRGGGVGHRGARRQRRLRDGGRQQAGRDERQRFALDAARAQSKAGWHRGQRTQNPARTANRAGQGG